MPETLAAIATAPYGKMEWTAISLDAPRPDEVLVEVMAAGICHTDLSARDQYLPIPLPAVLGHEGAGIVRAVGSAVTTVREGDHVIMSQAFCGSCAQCRSGKVTGCLNGFLLGFGGRRLDGTTSIRDRSGADVSSGFLGQSSFARLAFAREVNVVPIPSDLPWETAAPLGCGVQTGAGSVFNLVKPAPNHALAIFGAGTVGLSAVMAAAHAGSQSITVVDVQPARLELARSLGATHTVDAGASDPVAEIKEITGGGADFVIEASGALAAGKPALGSLAPTGTCVLVGAPPFGSELALDWIRVVSGPTVTGCVFGGAHPGASIATLLEMRRSGALPIERLVQTYSFEQMDQAIADMESGVVIKPVLVATTG